MQIVACMKFGGESRERLVETCRERGYKPPQKRWGKTGWEPWQLNLLEKVPDARMASTRIGQVIFADARAMPDPAPLFICS